LLFFLAESLSKKERKEIDILSTQILGDVLSQTKVNIARYLMHHRLSDPRKRHDAGRLSSSIFRLFLKDLLSVSEEKEAELKDQVKKDINRFCSFRKKKGGSRSKSRQYNSSNSRSRSRTPSDSSRRRSRSRSPSN
jgi:hypothetical protein